MIIRHHLWTAFVLLAMAAAACGDGGSDISANGLVAHYELDGDGADLVGLSPGALTGGASVADRSGGDDGAVRFARGDFIEIAHSDALSLGQDFTISAWIRPESGAEPGSFQTIFEKSDPERGGHSRYGIWLRDGDLWACFEAADNSQQPCAQADGSVTVDSWQHVAAVRTGRRLILYVNGAEAANAFVGLHPVSQTPFNAFIGTDRYQEPPEWLHAALDDVRIYDRPLSAEEIAALFAG